MAAPLLLLAAGGTGGHMFPAQALAEAMLARGWRVQLSTDARGARYSGGFPPEVMVRTIPSATFARGGPLARLAVPFRLLAGVLGALRQMRADRPAVVAGFGGYPSIPALTAAGRLRLPRLIHEQNGVLGRVNARFAPRVELVCCGTWPTALPSGLRAEHTGNPVRAAVRARAGAPYTGTGGRLGLLVIGGSQGARALSDLVPPALAALPDALRSRLDVDHQARPEDLDRVSRAYAEAGIPAVVRPFFDDLPERLAAATLVIARAGASSVADLTVIGRPSILIPYPYAAADHQSANARPLAEAGAAVVLPESGLDAAALTQHSAAILGDPGRAGTMAQAALALGRPDAAEGLADLVEGLAAGRTVSHPRPDPQHRSAP